MLYELAHTIQSYLPFVWNLIEDMNSFLFVVRYGKKLKVVPNILNSFSTSFSLCVAENSDAPDLAEFFSRQPVSAYEYFKPHNFDRKTIEELVRRKSYLFFLVKDEEKIVGYYFLRCFFMGKSYLGKIVDVDYRGKGIGKLMCLSAMEVATSMGLHMYETISKNNIASLYSTQKVLDTKILKEMPGNYIYIEDLPKAKNMKYENDN